MSMACYCGKAAGGRDFARASISVIRSLSYVLVCACASVECLLFLFLVVPPWTFLQSANTLNFTRLKTRPGCYRPWLNAFLLPCTVFFFFVCVRYRAKKYKYNRPTVRPVINWGRDAQSSSSGGVRVVPGKGEAPTSFRRRVGRRHPNITKPHQKNSRTRRINRWFVRLQKSIVRYTPVHVCRGNDKMLV